jgi:hypothetical protein
VSATRPGRKVGTAAVALGILVVSLLLAGVVSSYAASSPDGLTKVSEDQGFGSSATTHATEEGPFAGYAASFVGDDRLSGGLAGVVGVLVVLALGTGLTLVVRRRGGSSASAGADPGPGQG